MSTSGVYLFDPTLAEVVDEAFEQCEIDPAMITGRHIRSARRSLNFLFEEWINEGVKQWATEQLTITVAQGQTSYVMPVGTVDILSAVYRRDGYDAPMYPIGMDEYNKIPNKDIPGRITRYFMHRKTGQPILYVYQSPERSGDTIVYWRLRQIQDASGSAQTADNPWRFKSLMCTGLAAKLAVKFAPKKLSVLMALYKDQFYLAKLEDRQRGVLSIQPSM